MLRWSGRSRRARRAPSPRCAFLTLEHLFPEAGRHFLRLNPVTSRNVSFWWALTEQQRAQSIESSYSLSVLLFARSPLIRSQSSYSRSWLHQGGGATIKQFTSMCSYSLAFYAGSKFIADGTLEVASPTYEGNPLDYEHHPRTEPLRL